MPATGSPIPNFGSRFTANRSEPPDDEQLLLWLRVYYQEAKTDALKLQYSELKRNTSTQIQYASMDAGPPPRPEVFDALKQLARRIEAETEELRKLAEQLPTSHRAEARERMRNDQRAEAHELYQRLADLPTY